MANKIKRSVLLDCVHRYLFKKADRDGVILRKELPSLLGIGFHIPKTERSKVIKELEERGVIIESKKNYVKVKIISISF